MKFSPVAKYRMARWSAVLNLAGTLLVFLSFQAHSSDFFLTNLKDGSKALCVGNNALIVWGAGLGHVGWGQPNGCIDVADTPKVAIVTVESPAFLTMGWAFLLLGFLLQLVSIEPPKSEPRQSFGPRQRSPKDSN